MFPNHLTNLCTSYTFFLSFCHIGSRQIFLKYCFIEVIVNVFSCTFFPTYQVVIVQENPVPDGVYGLVYSFVHSNNWVFQPWLICVLVLAFLLHCWRKLNKQTKKHTARNHTESNHTIRTNLYIYFPTSKKFFHVFWLSSYFVFSTKVISNLILWKSLTVPPPP